MSKADQKSVARYFKKKPVLYIGGLGHIFGLQAGLLLGQLLYWQDLGKRKDGFIYKTAEEIQEELGMTRTSQETAIRKLLQFGIIEYKLAQVPARRHFKVNLERLHELLPSLKKTSKLNYPNPSNYYVRNSETITKITRQNTSENTLIPINRSNYAEQRQQLIRSKSRAP